MDLFLSNVLTAFTQVVILFTIAMVGFACHKIGVYTEKASRMTTDLLFYIVAPAIIIRSFMNMEFNRDSLKGLLLALLGGVFFHTVGMIFAKVFFNKGEKDTASIFKYASCYGNVGYMALPLAQAVLGDEGVFYCSVIMVPFNILSFSHGVSIMKKREANEKFNLKKLIINPGVIGVGIALPLFLLQVKLPEVIFQPVSYLADLNTPLAMVMFGTYLASADWKTLFSDKRIWGTVGLKIIAMPLITLIAVELLSFFSLDCSLISTGSTSL